MNKKSYTFLLFVGLMFLFNGRLSAQPKFEFLKDTYYLNKNDVLFFTDSYRPFENPNALFVQRSKSNTESGSISSYSTCTYDVAKNQNSEYWYRNCHFFKAANYGNITSSDKKNLHLYDCLNLRYWRTFGGSTPSSEIRISENPYRYYIIFVNHGKSGFYNLTRPTELENHSMVFLRTNNNDEYYAYIGKKDNASKYQILYGQKKHAEKYMLLFRFANGDYVNENISRAFLKQDNVDYLIMERNYKLGACYNTMIFPADIPLTEVTHVYNNGKNKMVLYRLESIENNELHFVRDFGDVIKANVPYILKSEKGDGTSTSDKITEVYLSSKLPQTSSAYDIFSTSNSVMEGGNIKVFASYFITNTVPNESSDKHYYVMHNNKLTNCGTDNNVKVRRYRWYVECSDNAKIRMYFDGTTDIDEAEDTDNEPFKEETVYDISGRKCGNVKHAASLKKGCYIVDGKVKMLGK